MGDNFEKRASGFVDFLLLDFRGIPTSRSKPIPMSPLEVQKEIVAEIEGYQNVIDGAHDILENYRPHIAIDPSWPNETLGETCEKIMDGTHFSPQNSDNGERLYLTFKNVRENYLDLSNISYVTEAAHREIFLDAQ